MTVTMYYFKLLFFVVALTVVATFGIVEYSEYTSHSTNRNSELQHQIQKVTCVQSKYWICDVLINDTVVLGYRSPVELQTGDQMWTVHKGGRMYLFGK